MSDQATLDRCYEEGKAAFRREFGSHGPTLRPPASEPPRCPYRRGSKRAQAWERGYYQDVRRGRP